MLTMQIDEQGTANETFALIADKNKELLQIYQHFIKQSY